MFRFSSRQENGLLLWQGSTSSRHYLGVAVVAGRIQFRFNMGGTLAVIKTKERVNTGEEREVVVVRNGKMGSVTMDSGEMVSREVVGGGGVMKARRSPIYLGKFANHPGLLTLIHQCYEYICRRGP